MKTISVSMTLKELQQAVAEYCEKHCTSQPEVVNVESYGKVVICMGLQPGATIEAVEFRHRAT